MLDSTIETGNEFGLNYTVLAVLGGGFSVRTDVCSLLGFDRVSHFPNTTKSQCITTETKNENIKNSSAKR